MHCILDGAPPHSGTANLIRAPISFDYEQVTVSQTKPIQLTLEKLNLVDLAEVQRPTPNVGYTQKRELVLHRTALALLLNTPSNVADLIQLDPSPPRRKLSLPVHAHTQASS